MDTRLTEPLTARETEVLRLLERGMTNPQIAQTLGISLDGAKYHVSQILSKLGVSSREAAVGRSRGVGLRRGWLGWPLIAKVAGGAFVLATVVGIAVFGAAVLADGDTGAVPSENSDVPLEGVQANVTVYYGGGFLGIGAGAVELIASAPEGVALLEAELSGVGWPDDFTMTLTPNAGAPTCDSAANLLAGFGGADYTEFASDLPEPESVVPEKMHLRVHYRADGSEHWTDVAVTDACPLAG